VPAFEVTWDAEARLLTTRVPRALSVHEVAGYESALERVIAAVPDQTRFVWLSDATGYEALANRAAHEAYRVILPRRLAEHGFRTSLLDLYDAELPTTCARGVACTAVAHVHHDAEKMLIFDQRFGRDAERYFSDASAARRWLLRLGAERITGRGTSSSCT
jgi:dienelactone hydrolase